MNSKLIIMVSRQQQNKTLVYLGFRPLEHTNWKENDKSLYQSSDISLSEMIVSPLDRTWLDD